MSWIDGLAKFTVDAVGITIVSVDGSSPREVGASMLVTADGIEGTIGGGALEHQAMMWAQSMLGMPGATLWQRETVKLALGPSLGQCCGGVVGLLFELARAGERQDSGKLPADPGARMGVVLRPLASGIAPRFVTERKDTAGLPVPVARAVADMLSGLRPRRASLIRDWLIEPVSDRRPKLYLYGAGHVGRAIVAVAAALPLDVVWVDTGSDRFPAAISGDIRVEIAADPAAAAGKAEAGCYHLVMTFSHAIDLAVCHVLLQGGDFAFLGLIGSMTKRGRFRSRLRQAGIGDAALQRLTCPIGIGGITGKEPATIAVSAVAQLLQKIEAAAERLPVDVMGAARS